MIRSFKHKGLNDLFTSGSKKGINPEHASKLTRVLDRLDASVSPKDMELPGYFLHRLKGIDKDTWSVRISGNWRVVFKFEGENTFDVDYIDYH